jgi:murein DD-endopeptidase MepM/ murein hydrolase activator NlpD/type II secretory pathway pseudopilin PulG
MVIDMRRTLLLLCIAFMLSSCVSAQEAQEELQRQAQEEAQRQVDQAVDQATEEANRASDSFFDGVRQQVDTWTEPVRVWWNGVQDWWDGLWGDQADPQPDPQPDPANPSIYVITTDRARGRPCANTTPSCEPVARFNRGDEITVTGTIQGEAVNGNSDWLVVSHQNSTIYVHSSLAAPKVPLADLPPDVLLPFAGTKYYTGGPHDSNDTRGCVERALDVSNGIDFSSSGSDRNFEVLAIAGGVILDAVEWDGEASGAGTFVKIQHANGLVSEYWHLSSISDEVKELMKGSNRTVVQGYPLGFAGATGNQDSVHLHLRISRGWHGQSIDGWTIWMHLKPGSNDTGLNYQGSATKGQTKEHAIRASSCNGRTATAIVGQGFTGTEERNGVDGNTLFAEAGSLPRAPMTSSNQRRTK